MNTQDEVYSDHYVIKGKRYTRITSLIAAVGLSDFSKIPHRDREFYMARGKANHRLFEDVELGRDHLFNYDPRIEVYRAGHARFLRETGFKPLAGGIEKRVHSDDLEVAGTLDRFGVFQGSLSLIDYKTSVLPPAAKPGLPTPTEIQTALYLICLPQYRFDEVKRFGVAFRKDGTYRMSQPYPITNKAQALGYVAQYHKETK
jgi:ATP-dependent exoDNAse (exonuclease V) beta subunit